MNRPKPLQLHANCVAWAGQAVLITGASGTGKSSLSLHLMALGCDLVADDRTDLAVHQGALWAQCPEAIKGWIEARGIGILPAQWVETARLCCVIDLDQSEQDRLPPVRHRSYLDISLPLFHNSDTGAFAYAILQYLKGQAHAASQPVESRPDGA